MIHYNVMDTDSNKVAFRKKGVIDHLKFPFLLPPVFFSYGLELCHVIQCMSVQSVPTFPKKFRAIKKFSSKKRIIPFHEGNSRVLFDSFKIFGLYFTILINAGHFTNRYIMFQSVVLPGFVSYYL